MSILLLQNGVKVMRADGGKNGSEQRMSKIHDEDWKMRPFSKQKTVKAADDGRSDEMMKGKGNTTKIGEGDSTKISKINTAMGKGNTAKNGKDCTCRDGKDCTSRLGKPHWLEEEEN